MSGLSDGEVTDSSETVVGFDTSGNAYFSGHITATGGKIGASDEYGISISKNHTVGGTTSSNYDETYFVGGLSATNIQNVK
jgi:hypothetical protein